MRRAGTAGAADPGEPPDTFQLEWGHEQRYGGGSTRSGRADLRALRSAGLRVTMPRLAMLAWLADHPQATVDAIAAGVRERFWGMCPACQGS